MIELNLSKKFENYIRRLASDKNVTFDELIEEALLYHYNIALSDFGSDPYEGDYNVFVYFDPREAFDASVGGYNFEFTPFYVTKATPTEPIDEPTEMLEEIYSDGFHPQVMLLASFLSEESADRMVGALVTTLGTRKTGGPLLNVQEEVPIGIESVKARRDDDARKAASILKSLNTSIDKNEAAEKAGISIRSLYRYIKDYDIRREKGIYQFANY